MSLVDKYTLLQTYCTELEASHKEGKVDLNLGASNESVQIGFVGLSPPQIVWGNRLNLLATFTLFSQGF